MRQASDPEFSQFLDTIGDDSEHDEVDLSRLNHTNLVEDAVNFVFSPDVVCDPETCVDRAILSPFNEYVDQFNSEVLGRLPGETHSYFSSDWIEEDGQEVTDHPMATPDFLNSLNEPGIPPHQLILKVGAICRFTRNFDASRGLTKNTRVIVRRLLHHSVEVEIIPTILAGQRIDSVSYMCFHA